MPREEISVDIPKEWNENMRYGRCWCGKSKNEFDKGQKYYCSKDHSRQYSGRIVYWSTFKDEILEEKGKKCSNCNKTKEIFDKEQKALEKNILLQGAKDHPDAIHEARSIMLKELQEKYEKIWHDDYVFEHMNWQIKEKFTVPKKYDLYDRIWFGLEVDHIKAVALGGSMWDRKNLQVLCNVCHKLKTKEDMKKIKQYKKSNGIEKLEGNT